MRRPRTFSLGILIVLLLSAPPARAMRMETVAIPVQNIPGSRMPSEPIPGILELPDGTGRFPAIILMHGCGGRGQPQQTWAYA